MQLQNITCPLVASLTFLLPISPSLPLSAPHQVNIQPPTSHPASLREHGGAWKIVQRNYVMFLFTGCSIEQHSAAIETDIMPHIIGIMGIMGAVWTDRIVYIARNVNNELVDSIRADPGVEFVDLDHELAKLRLVGDTYLFDTYMPKD
ncbi:hypothetical protein DL98DRAFT_256123 [Cadophora sp. DSE1049]|nr:hypothetical protein DL98DRAFT_256123 [Cadophora sp. DSE1049]